LKFLIVGGGISGLFLSYYLLEGGHDVVIADASRGNVRTSAYNAGQLSSRSLFTDVFSRSDVVRASSTEKRRNPRWFRLARGQTADKHERATTPLAARSLALYEKFLARERPRVDLTREVLDLHSHLGDGGERGSEARFLGSRELSELGYEGFEGGWLEREISLHSGKLVDYLRSRASDMGAEAIEGEVHPKIAGSRITHALVDGKQVVADAYVVAGGSWSREICRPLRYDPMVIPARGLVLFYRTRGKRVVDYPAHYADEGVTVGQHGEDVLRLTSFFELVGFDPRFSQSKKDWLFEAVTSHFSRPYRLELSEVGVGYRPCTPDQLPVLGRIPRCENGYIIAGANRKGMVLAPVLSQLLMECVFGSGGKDGPLLRALDPARFE
jgi:glycine/D-amino acid oxidase-like deaminating enzyme